MTALKDLKAVATAKPFERMGKEATLSLDAEDEIDKAVHALGRLFAVDNSHNAVRLEVCGDKIGYLNRRDFFAGRAHPRLGESEPDILPGPAEYSFIKLACPFDGCNTLILKIHYDERSPARCPMHPDKILHVVT